MVVKQKKRHGVLKPETGKHKFGLGRFTASHPRVRGSNLGLAYLPCGVSHTHPRPMWNSTGFAGIILLLKNMEAGWLL